MRRLASVALLGLAAGAVAFAVRASSAEEPPHDVTSKDGDFEVRDYPALTIAEVTVDADRNAAGNAGFRKLAGFIFGGNAKGQKIAMTAPVIEAAAGAGWTIRFVMPKGFTLANLPKPDDPSIRFAEQPPAHYAVLRFSGFAEDGSTEARTRELERLIQAKGLAPAGPPLIAQYNPPWIPGFMRRNEIMIPVR
jgi:hypothetical protein